MKYFFRSQHYYRPHAIRIAWHLLRIIEDWTSVFFVMQWSAKTLPDYALYLNLEVIDLIFLYQLEWNPIKESYVSPLGLDYSHNNLIGALKSQIKHAHLSCPCHDKHSFEI